VRSSNGSQQGDKSAINFSTKERFSTKNHTFGSAHDSNHDGIVDQNICRTWHSQKLSIHLHYIIYAAQFSLPRSVTMVSNSSFAMTTSTGQVPAASGILCLFKTEAPLYENWSTEPRSLQYGMKMYCRKTVFDLSLSFGLLIPETKDPLCCCRCTMFVSVLQSG